MNLGSVVKLGNIFPDTFDEEEKVWNYRVVRLVKKLKDDAWEVQAFNGNKLVVYEHEIIPLYSYTIFSEVTK
jgi:hypothetical protein